MMIINACSQKQFPKIQSLTVDRKKYYLSEMLKNHDFKPYGYFYIHNKKQKDYMVRVQQIAAFLFILLVHQASAYSAPPLCNSKLYQALKGTPGRLTGGAMQADLFNTMNYATLDQASMVLERMAFYSSARNPFLKLINESYAIEKVYQSIDDQLKYDFSYEQYCTDICETTGEFSLGPAIPAPKPLQLTNDDTPTCKIPDNLLCSDFTPREDHLRDILDRFGIQEFLQTESATIYYRINNQGKLRYCATYDLQQKKITHVCEKYQQWRSLKRMSQINIFTDAQYNQLVTSDPDKQYTMNYILSKYKFGQRLGKILNDCLRYGPLTF